MVIAFFDTVCQQSVTWKLTTKSELVLVNWLAVRPM